MGARSRRDFGRIVDHKASPRNLFERHQERKPELEKKFGKPKPVSPQLKAFAAEIDVGFERLLGG